MLPPSATATWHWLSAKTLGCIAAGLVLLVLWVRSESRSREPLVDMKMMRIRGVWTTNAVALLLGFGMYASFILLPQFVEAPARAGYGFGASVTQAGLFLVPTTAAMLIVSTQTGRLEKLFGSKPLLLVGAGLAFASFATLALARGERWEIYVASALLGSGIGLAFAAMANLIIENVGAAQTGVATGMNTVTRTVGGGFGGAATASLLAGTVGLSGYPTAHGYTAAFAVCAIRLPRGRRRFGIRSGRPEAFGPHPSTIPPSPRLSRWGRLPFHPLRPVVAPLPSQRFCISATVVCAPASTVAPVSGRPRRPRPRGPPRPASASPISTAARVARCAQAAPCHHVHRPLCRDFCPSGAAPEHVANAFRRLEAGDRRGDVNVYGNAHSTHGGRAEWSSCPSGAGGSGVGPQPAGGVPHGVLATTKTVAGISAPIGTPRGRT